LKSPRSGSNTIHFSLFSILCGALAPHFSPFDNSIHSRYNKHHQTEKGVFADEGHSSGSGTGDAVVSHDAAGVQAVAADL
jgi:hypothetical protein